MMQEASTVMKVEEVKIAKRTGGRPQSEVINNFVIEVDC